MKNVGKLTADNLDLPQQSIINVVNFKKSNITFIGLWLGFCVYFIIISTSIAGENANKLDIFYRNVKSMQADFQQSVVDSDAKLIQQASGRLIMQRPGKFRWDYIKPYEQSIISNGVQIWIYDKDLEQVTTKPVDSVLGNTPALLLSGNTSIEKQFTFKQEISETDGLEWIVLTPKEKEVSFSLVRLAFKADRLLQMELLDNFGQTTKLQFTKLENNPTLDLSLFEFEIPKGVDVIGE